MPEFFFKTNDILRAHKATITDVETFKKPDLNRVSTSTTLSNPNHDITAEYPAIDAAVMKSCYLANLNKMQSGCWQGTVT
jgi:hypothetical protein